MTGDDRDSTRLEKNMEEEEEVSILIAWFEKEVLKLGRKRWAARVTYMSVSINNIVSEIQERTVVEFSDSSFKYKLVTAC